MYERIYLSPPHLSGQEKELIADALASNWIAPLGPHVDAFEREVADMTGCRGALAVSSGTAAIHLALRYLGVGAGDIVFCSSLTFIGSANPIIYLGAEPVFIDSEPESWNMSPGALERALIEAESTGVMPKAVIVVNLYGQSADYDRILTLCSTRRIPVLEDAAESLGATYRNRESGSLGTMGVFSFNGNKIITTSGGGMLVSDDLEALGKARFWATQAREPHRHYEHQEVGYNYRMSNILAAIGRGQLRVLKDRVLARRAIFERYRSGLSDIDTVSFMPEISDGMSNRWLSVMLIDSSTSTILPSRIMDALEAENIEARPVWKPLHMQPVFQACRYYSHHEGSSVSDDLYLRGVCLPSGSNLSESDQNRVIAIIRRVLG